MKHILSTFGKVVAASMVIMASLLLMSQPAAALFLPDPPPGPATNPSSGIDNNNAQSICTGSGGTWNGSSCSNGGPTLMGTIGNITNVLLFITGAIAVVMIIVGGIRYATSGGEQSAVTGAKNTILYAVIGLVVTFTAYAIVNFVLVQVFK